MALIKCPECGHSVRDNAKTCQYCGFSFSEELKRLKDSEKLQKKKGKEDKSAKTLTLFLMVGIPVLVATIMIISTHVADKRRESEQEQYWSEKRKEYGISDEDVEEYKSRINGAYNSDYSEEIEAATFALAEKAVKSNLKAPSTAKFCKQSECDFDSLGNNQYQMSGWVDAENGFGAMIRSNWYIVAELDGTKMKLVSVLVG